MTLFNNYLAISGPIISSSYLIPVGCLQQVVVDATSYPPMVAASTPALAKNVIIGMLFMLFIRTYIEKPSINWTNPKSKFNMSPHANATIQVLFGPEAACSKGMTPNHGKSVWKDSHWYNKRM